MSGHVAQGKQIGIVGHLECPDGSTLFAQAIVKDDQENTLETVSLTDQGEGRFTGETTMPDRPWIQVIITVYDDAGFTMQNEDYCPITQTFHRDDGGEGGGSGGQKDEEISGFVASSVIDGSVSGSEDLRGKIEIVNLIGRVDIAPVLKGDFDSQELIGIVECE